MPSDPALITGRLNVNDYVAARSSDIKKLGDLLSNAGTNSKKRAFQSLPRVERRRAASHDPKRVPRKRGLRKKAEFENLRDNSKKRKQRARPSPKLESASARNEIDVSTTGRKCSFSDLLKANLRYSDRQRDKIWLPTHIWHRKRAFLTNIAGIMVPQTATQKQYRRMYRLTSHIDEHGAMAWDSSFYSTLIVRHNQLDETIGPLFPGLVQPFYRNGEKHWQGMLKNVGPVLIHWFQANALAIQCHPLIFDDLWALLRATSEDILLEDCRYAIGSIDLIGPWAPRVLTEMLRLAAFSSAEDRDNWVQFRTYNILPSRAVFNLFASDPRLFTESHKTELSIIPIIEQENSTDKSGIYSKTNRADSVKHKMSQSDVDQARLKGNETSVQKGAPIPITILGLDDGRIRILLPRDWVLPFWLTLFKKRHVLIGGQQELHQLAFELGLPKFPQDFPETSAGSAFNSNTALEQERAYNKKPKSKRVDYSKELGNPFKLADLDLLGDEFLNNCAHVSLKAIERGVPKPGARIYELPPDPSLSESGRIADPRLTTSEHLIGFVTSGNFAFSSAKGAGIGVIKHPLPAKTCVVKNVGAPYGFLVSISTIQEIHRSI